MLGEVQNVIAAMRLNTRWSSRSKVRTSCLQNEYLFDSLTLLPTNTTTFARIRDHFYVINYFFKETFQVASKKIARLLFSDQFFCRFLAWKRRTFVVNTNEAPKEA